MSRVYEIRCPVHGFIEIDEWERDIINHPTFQRLRRIRQLGLTDYVYPGAMHTRFEHSLGVMHVATQLYDAIVKRSKELLVAELNYNDEGLSRHRRVVRLAALLHDVGHSPFSHASEELFPKRASVKGEHLTHEDYSAAIIRTHFRELIEGHALGKNFAIRADDVAALIDGSTQNPALLFWREVISGQMDADRMDYLLRDSYHLGVQYGRYDLDRLLNTVCAILGTRQEQEKNLAMRVGVQEGGWHALESLILARYYMFTQVYFHPTRMAYDHHIQWVLRTLLPKGQYPDLKHLDAYLEWDDARVWGEIVAGKADKHGEIILQRRHYRAVFWTSDVYGPTDEQNLERARKCLKKLLKFEAKADKSWYKVGVTDVPILMEQGGRRALSALSFPVQYLKPIRKVILYVDLNDRAEAQRRLQAESLYDRR